MTARLFEVAIPLPVSFGKLSTRKMLLVSVHAGGLVGRGESWVNWPHWAAAERVITVSEGVAPLVIGADANDREGIFGRLTAELLPVGRQWGAIGPIWQAISAVDVALWDLAGQWHGCSVSRLLSGTPATRVPAYASGIGPTDVISLTERALSQGFTAAKVKVGFGLEADRKILHDVRAVAGSSLVLFADANRAWSLGEGIEMCRLLADFGVAWCEEPLADDQPDDLEQLFDATGMPIALGENCYGTEPAARYLASPGIQHFQPDVSKTGGITMALRLSALAAAEGKRITPHCYGGACTLLASAQLSAAIGNLGWLELDIRDNPFRDNVAVGGFKIVDGYLDVPSGPGLGMDMDETVLRSFEVEARR
ncbi:MAG: mandelate racemase/muconate lactonizing enzyme family protein [Haloechinothrix sp.]